MSDKMLVRDAILYAKRLKVDRDINIKLSNYLKQSENDKILLELCNILNINSTDLFEYFQNSIQLYNKTIDEINHRIDNTYLVD